MFYLYRPYTSCMYKHRKSVQICFLILWKMPTRYICNIHFQEYHKWFEMFFADNHQYNYCEAYTNHLLRQYLSPMLSDKACRLGHCAVFKVFVHWWLIWNIMIFRYVFHCLTSYNVWFISSSHNGKVSFRHCLALRDALIQVML